MNKNDAQLLHDIFMSGRKTITVIAISTENGFTGGNEYTVVRETPPGSRMQLSITDDHGIRGPFTPESAERFNFNGGTPISVADTLMAKRMFEATLLHTAAKVMLLPRPVLKEGDAVVWRQNMANRVIPAPDQVMVVVAQLAEPVPAIPSNVEGNAHPSALDMVDLRVVFVNEDKNTDQRVALETLIDSRRVELWHARETDDAKYLYNEMQSNVQG